MRNEFACGTCRSTGPHVRLFFIHEFIIRPAFHSSIHNPYIFEAGSGKNRLGLVGAQAGLTEGDDFFVFGNFLDAAAQHSQGDELHPWVFNPFSLVFFG
jgi:hypothetical protein